MRFLPKCCFAGSASTSTKQPSTFIEHLCHRFSLPQLEESSSNFSQFICRDGFDRIYRGCITIDGQPKEVAVKRIETFSTFKNEILTIGQLHHPNLTSIVGFCDDKHEKIVVYEYIPNQSLDYHLHERGSLSKKLSWKERLEISIGVARGLHYLHSGTKRTIIHRDVRPWNILLDENWIPKLTGFGFSMKGPKFSAKATTKSIDVPIAGTLGYLAPECLHDHITTYKCDVYSFGVVLIELICAKNPWDFQKMIDLEHQGKKKEEGEHALQYFYMDIARKARDLLEKGNGENIIDPNLIVGEIAAECWNLYMDIAESCLSEDPNERPDMGEVEVELERALELQEKAHANHT